MLDQGRSAPVTVSLDVVWQDSAGKQDARMSEISMQGCYIDTKVQGRTIGETVGFKVHLPGGPWVSLQGELINQEYPHRLRPALYQSIGNGSEITRAGRGRAWG